MPCHTSRVPPPTTLGTPGQAPLGSGTSFPPLPKGSLGSKCTSSKKSTSKNKLSHSALTLGSAPAELLTDRHCVRGSQRKPLPLGAESSSAALELHPAPVGNKTCSESHPQPDRSSCQTPARSRENQAGCTGRVGAAWRSQRLLKQGRSAAAAQWKRRLASDAARSAVWHLGARVAEGEA